MKFRGLVGRFLVFLGCLAASGIANSVEAQPETLWAQTYDVAMDVGRSVIETADGGFLIAADSYPFDAESPNILLLKTDPAGALQWQKVLEESARVRSFVRAGDDGYVIMGRLTGDVAGAVLIKLDGQGEVAWRSDLGEESESASALVATADGGYAAAGWKRVDQAGGAGEHRAYLLKADGEGAVEWDTTYVNEGFAVINTLTSDRGGGVTLGGFTRSSPTSDDQAFLLKTDEDGKIEWRQTFGGGGADWISALVQTEDGGYIATGWTTSFGDGNNDAYLARTDGEGTVLWERGFGGDDTDQGRDVVQDMDGGFVLAGWTRSFGSGSSDIYVARADSEGTLLWEKTIDEDGTEQANGLALAGDGSYVVTGWTDTFGGNDILLATIASSVVLGTDDLEGRFSQAFSLGAAHPNPFDHRTTISFELSSAERVTLTVYDILGRAVEMLVDAAGRPAGMRWRSRQVACRRVCTFIYCRRDRSAERRAW